MFCFQRLKKASRHDVPRYYFVVHTADHSHEDLRGRIWWIIVPHMLTLTVLFES